MNLYRNYEEITNFFFDRNMFLRQFTVVLPYKFKKRMGKVEKLSFSTKRIQFYTEKWINVK